MRLATVKFISPKRAQAKGSLHGVLQYCTQDYKTQYQGRNLVSGVNCVPQFAFREFMNTKDLHGKAGGRMYYHLIQSFHPEENLTPDTAHEIALKLAEQFQGYEVVVATHTDRDHIHSHFIINSVNLDTGEKYHSNTESLQALRNASDQICLEYGLSIVKPKRKRTPGMSDREYRAAYKGESWKQDLAIAIDRAMEQASSREHFIRLMEWEGYQVRWTAERKNITYTTPSGMKCRDSKLHEEKYRKELMEYEFTIRAALARRNEGTPAADAQQGRGRPAYGSGDGSELAGDDRFPAGAGQNTGRNSQYPSHAGDSGADGRLHESAARDSAEGRRSDDYSHGTVPEGSGSGSTESSLSAGGRHKEYEPTGWEHERELWAAALRGAGADGVLPKEAVLDFSDPQLDHAALGMDAAYLAADISSLIDERPVEDSTTTHYRLERKKHQGYAMGGM